MTGTGAQDYLQRQEQRSRISRQQILDAAVQCLVRYGYAGASTVRIQELAGISRGRLLHHYPSRDELLVGAVQHLAAGRVAELRQEVGATITADAAAYERIDQAIEQMWKNFDQPFFWASVELWLAARHNQTLREALHPAERQLQNTIYETIEIMFGPVWAARPLYRHTVDVLLSSMRGVSMTYGFDPREPAKDPHIAVWNDTARALLAG
ncbi:MULTISPECIES: TetR/AcrR family transcriptional regulator [Nocardia]|uniref:TetR/AcrR family transcriptional regulator n=1 Tax=Nocardia TaxID=1817 RepID=UPI001E4AAD6A|nr:MULTISPECIES: TetR/AcrR family transcriptional regulator [Nocardia]